MSNSVALVALTSLMLTACKQTSAIWLQSSTRGHVVFGWGERPQEPPPPAGAARLFIVFPCGHDSDQASAAVWSIYGVGAPPARPNSVIYGRTPPGYRVVKPARPLTPGCYVAADGGTGYLEFIVQEDARVRERTSTDSRPRLSSEGPAATTAAVF